ncbi:MAG TPA: TonB-dependent receptor [Candidatus Angelobacter sp.]|nr:TonB-dependent receptor [Candidatus Angelobacter sp.]
MRKSLYFSLSICICIVFWFAAARAQERKGSITGRVTDKEHAILQGARIELRPSGKTAVSDNQGQFTLTDLAPGHYTVTVSYVGFSPFSTETDVPAGGVANVDAAMQIGTRSEVVEVRADRQRGEVEAINRERTADNILQVLPSEVITSLPNTNIADAVGRLPSVSLERDEGEGKYVQIRGTEPRLSNVTIDGVHVPSPESVRNVKLDAIPADLVDSVEINKTLSANQDADAIGGSVNLVTKSATDQPYITLLGMGGYTPIAGGRSLDQFSATLGQRFGRSKRLGLMFGGSYDWNGRGIDDVEPSVGMNSLPSGQTFGGPNAEDLREYWYDRTRFGYGGTLDYKLGDWSTAYVKGLYAQFRDYGQDWIYSPTVGSFATQTTTNPDGTMSFTHVERSPSQQIFSVAAGARHVLGRSTTLNYELSLGQARFVGGFPRATFSNPDSAAPINNVQFGVDTSNPFTPRFPVLNGVNIFDPKAYFLDGLQISNTQTSERDVIGSISLARQYTAGSHFGSIEIGARVRDARKAQILNQQIFDADSTEPMSALLGSFTNPDYYFNAYPPFGPTTDYKKIIAFFNSNRGTFTENFNREHQRTDPNDFDTSERVSAGYVMNTINFGHFRLQTGVRIEATGASFLGNHVTLDSAGHFVSTTPVTGDNGYIDALPSAQLLYTFGGNTNIRLAYGMGIARPNFSDLPPFILEQDRRQSVSVGNPDLKPTHAQNFDLIVEHYLKPVGVIEGGVFYKYLTDPIFPVDTTIASGTFAGFTQTQPINGPSAHIAGVEMAWQQHLTFLPGLLNGMGVRANYSYTTSRASFPVGFGRTDHPALLRQAPNNWNFDATYDKKGISARMGLTHNDANIFQYNFQDGADGGIKGPNGDVYLYPHTQVDAQVSYWIPRGHGLQAIVSLLNLNNEVFGFYQGSEQFPIQREYYNRTVSAGLRWTLGREH